MYDHISSTGNDIADIYIEATNRRILFLYQDEMVDCVNPDSSANWYSVHCFCSLNSVICSSTFIIIVTV